MQEIFSQMLWPLMACFILVSIHVYLGLHVIARKVIFVDLAMAQIAGLGAVFGMFLGLDLEENLIYIKFISIGFTLMGALIFAFTRTDDKIIPQEAIIGIIYAAALSAALILSYNLSHGADQVTEMLAGSILWVTPKEIIYTAILYFIIALVHWLFRKQFFALSYNHTVKNNTFSHARFWDFLFYSTFGVVVTSSVGMGGVLLVFGFLIIPSVIGLMLAKNTQVRLLMGWISGILASVIGVVISYYLDWPTGPVIVVLLAVLLAIITLGVKIRARY